jgi:hypothetical protein
MTKVQDKYTSHITLWAPIMKYSEYRLHISIWKRTQSSSPQIKPIIRELRKALVGDMKGKQIQKDKNMFFSCMEVILKGFWSLDFFKDLYLPEKWSHSGMGWPSGCALCLQGRWVGWLWQCQQLQHQGKVSPYHDEAPALSSRKSSDSCCPHP